MLSKTKKLLLLSSGLAGALVVSSTAGVALSSCTVEAVNGGSGSSDSITLPDTWYSKDINWTDATSLNNLIIDKQGFVYSNKYKTEIIAILPGYESSTLVIPSTVTSITGYNNVTTTTSGETTTTTKTPTGAFEGLTSITNVKFAGKSITQIGSRAFYGCTSLQSVTLPSSVNLIAENAFANCSTLNTIDLSNIQYIGASAFAGAFTAVPYGSISLNLNKTVLVAAGAFQNATGVGSVDFSKNTTITQIAENAFSGCTYLSADIDLSSATKLITIGSSSTPLTTGSTFANTAITNIYLPSTLRTIAAQTFSNCANLENVGPKGNTTGFTAVEGITGIYNKAFAGTKITSVNVSTTTSTTPLQNGAFSGMTNLTSVNLGSTITSIPAACFANCTALTSLTFPSSITSISGGSPIFADITISSGSNASITTPPSITFSDDSTYSPFYGSGLTSIDLSTITSYQTTSGSTLNLPNGLFYNATNLTTVTLKEGTTSIGAGSFANTTALASINTGSSSSSEGYVATNSITSVKKYAFWQSGISSVNLSNISDSSYVTLPQAIFASCPNLTTIELPSTITTIADCAVNTTPNLALVNFSNLTKLKTINTYNFSSSQLTNIDLSNTVITSIGVNSFINLPVGAKASFPTTLNDGFQGIFTDTNSSTIPLNFPNGINSNFFTTSILSNGILQNILTTSLIGKINVLRNVGVLNLSNLTSVKSIGVNNFFQSSKLSSLTLPAKIVAGTTNTNHGMFIGNNITSNSSNTTSASSYTKDKVPFGYNEALTSLNYTNFTTTSIVDANSAQETLFNTTSETTWNEVAKIINSLSYQAYPSSSDDAKNLKANMSEWTPETNNPNRAAINTDATQTFTASTSGNEGNVSLTNSYLVESDTSVSVTINASDTSKTFVHNGITWTYTNDGTNITLTGQANMYRAWTSSSSSYLVFFNQTEFVSTSDTTIIYYSPSRTPINVTLTIATASSSSSNS